MKNLKTIINKTLNVSIYLVLILYLSSFDLRDSGTSGWTQQWIPGLDGTEITSITFLDSLTGFAVTNLNSQYNAYILKTTDGGYNWYIKYTYSYPNANTRFNAIRFGDSSTGYASIDDDSLYKTTDRGEHWFPIVNDVYPESMAVINKDTILVTNNYGPYAGVFRTTNGGYNFSRIWAGEVQGIYMFNKDFGFNIYQGAVSKSLRRTTNGGFNWTDIPNQSTADIKFYDTLVGWKGWGNIKKSTDGGLTWFSQQLPNLPNSWRYAGLSVIDSNNVWLVGNEGDNFGPIYKTTNGGINWGYQYADTSSHIHYYNFIQFINQKVGWASKFLGRTQVHTITGGNDTTFITGVNSNTSELPKEFELFQNYPNPFNSSTEIKWQMKKSGIVSIKVYDITGKEITTLANEEKQAGTYTVRFDTGILPSGIYFYKLSVNSKSIDVKKMVIVR